ncbi:MAG: nuclear transport factor 2 family protein [Acidimicrobiia bacterium]|nr:nuclear transport factor 2 family protein [Acidimicrobiia bacterium]
MGTIPKTPDAYVEAYLSERGGQPADLDRFVEESSGLDAESILEVIGNPRLGRQAIEVMADLMRPHDSIYYDAIFGAYHGQRDIRAWLVPAMAEIEFIDFVPTAASVLFDDGEGGSSLDEWQMFANMEGERIPLSRGVSVRRYRDGWITYAADVYDTSGFRQPPPPGVDAPDLPDWPRVAWPTEPDSSPEPPGAAASAWMASRAGAEPGRVLERPSGLGNLEMHQVLNDATRRSDSDVMADLMHPTDMQFIDPLFGELRGQAEVRACLADITGKAGAIAFDPVGPVLFDGATSVQEWVQVAVLADGSRVDMTRGTTVRRFADGWLVYAAEYYDTAPLADLDVQAAAAAAAGRPQSPK